MPKYTAIQVTKDNIKEIVESTRGLEQYLYSLVHDLVFAAECDEKLYIVKIEDRDGSSMDFLTVNGEVFNRVYRFVDLTAPVSDWREITKK